MKRREFIAALGGAAIGPVLAPFVASAQQPTMPMIGLLGSGSPGALFTAALAQGLQETGYVEGQNVLVEYRWARGAYDRLPNLAAELVDRRVSVIITFGTAAVRPAMTAARRAIPVIPIVFSLGSDPVAEGFVTSLNRPGGNMTGATSIAGELAPKRMEFLREFLREQAVMAILVNPDNPLGEAERRDAEAASRQQGQRLEVLTASNENEIDAVFAALKPRKIDGLIISVDTFYFGQVRRMAQLAARHAVPVIGTLREFAAAGGLVSYGASISDVNRQAAVYVGKVLKGARPADLPIVQPTKFELVINLKAAKALGLNVPPSLFARADEVIE